MRVSYSQLKKLSVETKSGDVLGHVCDIVVEVEGHSILQYEVKSSMLSTKKYMIGREQVISITAEKVIVDDAVVGREKQRVALRGGEVGSEAVVMRNQDA